MKMLKKVVLSVVGGALVLVSIMLAAYVGIKSFQGSWFDIESLIKCGVVICCPLILGTILIIFSVQKENKRKIILLAELVMFFMYVIIIFALVFGGFRLRRYGYRYGFDERSLLDYIKFYSNFIPFKTIYYYITCFFTGRINLSIVIENLVGNFMMFMPMGFLLPAIFKQQKKWFCFLATLASILIGIEVVQLIFRLGSCDIDDFILNMTGACLIFAIIRIGVIKRALNKTMLI